MAYLASTRVAAGVIVVVPLYCVALLMAYMAARFGTTALYGQSTGVYDHYFRTFLIPSDVMQVVRHGGCRWRRSSCWSTPTTGSTPAAGPPVSGRQSDVRPAHR